jgi:YrbI family 3-deoxy-D-manno-octulosonate 8-phosphate phosphatase
MLYLEQNIKGLCSKNGIQFTDFLNDLDADNVHELTVFDLEAIAEEYEVDLLSLLFKPMFVSDWLGQKLKKIKLLVLDVDGVMTDGGMYMTENGDHIKKFNTKDGLAIQHVVKSSTQLAIISSGLVPEMVKARAKMLGIQHCYIGTEPKLQVLHQLIDALKINLDEVAIIGDDVNDLHVMRSVGLAVCPSDAVNAVKSESHIILTKKGGQGCVREFIDSYLLKKPLG